MLKPNGTLVYSTCSISVEENESVVQFALRKRFVKLVPTVGVVSLLDVFSCFATAEADVAWSGIQGIEFGRNGFKSMAGHEFHPNMVLARRIYPHVHNMDGFFVAKLEKFENGPRKAPKSSRKVV